MSHCEAVIAEIDSGKRLMRLITLPSFIAVIAVLLPASESFAQFGGNRIDRPLNGPTVSPYINLFRGQENGPVLNYFGIVRPQLQQMEQNEQFGMNLRAMQGNAGMQQQMMMGQGMGYSQLNITGHPAVFQSFTNGGGGGAGGGGFGGGGFGGDGFGGGGFGGGGGIGGGFGVGGLGGGGFGAGGLGGVGGFGVGGLGAGGFGGGGFGGGGIGGGYGGGGYGGGGIGGGGYGGGGIIGSGFGAGGLGMSGHPAAFGTFTNQRGQ